MNWTLQKRWRPLLDQVSEPQDFPGNPALPPCLLHVLAEGCALFQNINTEETTVIGSSVKWNLIIVCLDSQDLLRFLSKYLKLLQHRYGTSESLSVNQYYKRNNKMLCIKITLDTEAGDLSHTELYQHRVQTVLQMINLCSVFFFFFLYCFRN